MNLGQLVADAVVKSFNDLNVKSGKPVVRTNGVKEWTVLAGLVMIKNDRSIAPICLATGAKCLPDATRTFSNGRMVHDLHAEILCLRLFNWFLLDEAEKVSKGIASDYVDTDGSGFSLRGKLALYVSEPPCGDASMRYIAGDQQAWASHELDLVLGRNGFDNLGVVRTKPGRADSIISYSKSCSDKLCMKQRVGLTSAVTANLYPEVYLDYLVLQEGKIAHEDFNRCFGRLDTDRPLSLKLYENDSYPFHKSDGKPSPLSLLHIIPTNNTEVLNNGVKNGCAVKNTVKPRSESFACNYRLVMKAASLISLPATYHELKNSNKTRQKLKQECRETLGGWKATSADDFAIEYI